MVNQNDESQANLDPISEDQQQLDEQQGQVPTPQVATVDDIAALHNMMNRQSQQVNGLQGRVESGLTSVSQRQEQAIKRGFDDLKQQMYGQNLMSQVPEEHREWVAPIMETLQRQSHPPLDEPIETAPVSNPESDWQQVFDLVYKSGVDPRDPRILKAYPLLASGQPSDQGRFMASLTQIVREDAVNSASKANQGQAQAPRQVQTQQTVNPPIEPSPASSRGLNNADDLRDAFIQDKINFGEYQKRMVALGESV